MTSPLHLTGSEFFVYFFGFLAIFFFFAIIIPQKSMNKIVLPALLGIVILHWATRLCGIQENLLKTLGLIQ